MLDQPFLTSFQVSKLSQDNQFDKALNQILSPGATELHDTLKRHHDLGQSAHAQQIECSRDLKIVNAGSATKLIRPKI